MYNSEDEKNALLEMWQGRYKKSKDAYTEELNKMDKRDKAYIGEVEPAKVVENEHRNPAQQLRHKNNIIGELIDAQINTTIMLPKVTALNQEDEDAARLAEDMLRNELERMPIEEINDLAQRVCPVQGGIFYHIEWDNLDRSHDTVGELKLSALHPRQVIPQDGVTSGIDDMDYIFLRLPQTRDYIKRRYGIDIPDDDGSYTEDGGESDSPDMCMQIVAYYHSDGGRIGRFSWVGDTIVEDFPDFQSRRERRCIACGEPEPIDSDTPEKDDTSGEGTQDPPKEQPEGKPDAPAGQKTCPKCGGHVFEEMSSDIEYITESFRTAANVEVYGTPEMPEEVEYYRPDVFPLVMQKNTSADKQLLGGSDVDEIYSLQQTVDRVEQAAIDKLLKGGSIIGLPPDTNIRYDNEIGRFVSFTKPDQADMIKQFDLTVDISPDLAYKSNVYEDMRHRIGITDSFQGRNDSTAQSKVAKEFAAKQTMGRFESKNAMKQAAYSRLFEIMFQFKLAYTDEIRPVHSTDEKGQTVYDKFDKHQYIKRDADGKLYYDDRFLFSVDAAASLANDREAMWRENRMNLESGAYGNPHDYNTLLIFWTRMEDLNYPGATETKKVIESRIEEQQAMIAQQQAQQQNNMQIQQFIDNMARQQAERDAGM